MLKFLLIIFAVIIIYITGASTTLNHVRVTVPYLSSRLEECVELYNSSSEILTC